MYHARKLENIEYSGGTISSYILLSDEDIYPAPSIYLLDRAKNGASLNTSQTYAYCLKAFFAVLEPHQIPWQEVTDAMVSHYLKNYLLGERNLIEESIDIHIEALKDFYNWAWQRRLIDSPREFSFSYSHKDKDKSPNDQTNISLKSQYIKRKDFDLLLSNIISTDRKHKSYIVERNELIMLLGYKCGLRSAEVTDERNFEFENLRKEIEIAKNKSEKTLQIQIVGKGEKLRYVDINPELFERIDHFISGRRSKLKNGPLIVNYDGTLLSKKYASSVFSKAKLQLSVDEKKRFDSYVFHSLRHTFATDLVTWCHENGIDPKVRVPERLGHSNWSTTMGYIHFEAVKNGRSEVLEDLALYRKAKRSEKK